MSNSFERFRRTNQQRIIANKKLNSQFIIKGYPSIEITEVGGEQSSPRTQLACVVNKQEKDLAYIYTPVDAALTIGSVWSAKGLNWLIAEEIIIIKDVDWHKYQAFLCNTQIDDIWGYFIGPEKSYVNVALKQNVVLQSQQKPLLILPSAKALAINDIIIIKDRPWLIQEKDDISTDGLVYYSLHPTTVDKDLLGEGNCIYRPEPEKPQFETVKSADQLITETTEQGYFWRSTEAIEVIKLDRNSVTFKVPFGVSSDATIKVRQNGQIVIKKAVR